MRYLFLIFGLTVLAVMIVAGKRGDLSRVPPIELFADMDRQPKLRPQKPNKVFANGISSQLPVEGTVSRGSAWQDTPVNTGKVPGTTNWAEYIPVPITASLIKRGQERYNINCAPCHGGIGDGKGITTKYGMLVIANLHDPRIIRMSDGEVFNTITYGKNLMGPYAAQVPIMDRWAVIAYMRALQRARLASIEDVPADLRSTMARQLPPAATPIP